LVKIFSPRSSVELLNDKVIANLPLENSKATEEQSELLMLVLKNPFNYLKGFFNYGQRMVMLTINI